MIDSLFLPYIMIFYTYIIYIMLKYKRFNFSPPPNAKWLLLVLFFLSISISLYIYNWNPSKATAAAEKRSIRVRIPPIIVHHTYSATYGFPSVPPGPLPQLPPTIPSQLTTQTIHTWTATRLSQTQPRPTMAVVATVSSTLAAVDDLDGQYRSATTSRSLLPPATWPAQHAYT